MHYTHLFSWVIWRLSRARVVFNSFIGHSPASCTCAVKGLVTFRDGYGDDLGRTRYVITVHYLIRHNLACYKKSGSHQYLSVAISDDLRFYTCTLISTKYFVYCRNSAVWHKSGIGKENFLFCFKDLKLKKLISYAYLFPQYALRFICDQGLWQRVVVFAY